jgi:hypothetical protein
MSQIVKLHERGLSPELIAQELAVGVRYVTQTIDHRCTRPRALERLRGGARPEEIVSEFAITIQKARIWKRAIDRERADASSLRQPDAGRAFNKEPSSKEALEFGDSPSGSVDPTDPNFVSR